MLDTVQEIGEANAAASSEATEDKSQSSANEQQLRSLIGQLTAAADSLRPHMIELHSKAQEVSATNEGIRTTLATTLKTRSAKDWKDLYLISVHKRRLLLRGDDVDKVTFKVPLAPLERATLLTQIHVRNWLGRRKWNRLYEEFAKTEEGEAVRKRLKVLDSVVDLLKLQLSRLERIHDMYFVPLRMAARSGRGILEESEVLSGFANLEGITALHRLIQDQVNDTIKEWPDSHIFQILSNNESQMREAYCSLTASFSRAEEAIQSLSSRPETRKLINSFKQRQISEATGQDDEVGSLNSGSSDNLFFQLLEEMRSVCGHVVDIRDKVDEASKHVPEFHALNGEVQECLSLFKMCAKAVMSTRKGNVAELLELDARFQGGCPLLLTRNDRLLRKSGNIKAYVDSKKSKDRQLMLFTDVMVFSHVKDKGLLKIASEGPGVVWLHGDVVVDVPGPQAIKLLDGSQILAHIQVPVAAEHSVWVGLIRKMVETLPKPLKDASNGENGSDSKSVMELMVWQAGLNELVDRLCYAKGSDTDFMHAFLLGIPEISSPQVVLQMMKDRFNSPPPQRWIAAHKGLDAFVRSLHLRIVNCVKTWLQLFFVEDFRAHDDMMPLIMQFVVSLHSEAMQKTIKTQIQKHSSVEVKELAEMQEGDADAAKMSIFDFDAKQVAKEITRLDNSSFACVRFRHWLAARHLKSAEEVNQTPPPMPTDGERGIWHWAQRVDALCRVMVLEIIRHNSETGRTNAAKQVLSVAKACLNWHNFNGAKICIDALTSERIPIMSSIIHSLGKSDRESINKMQSLLLFHNLKPAFDKVKAFKVVALDSVLPELNLACASEGGSSSRVTGGASRKRDVKEFSAAYKFVQPILCSNDKMPDMSSSGFVGSVLGARVKKALSWERLQQMGKVDEDQQEQASGSALEGLTKAS